MASLSFLPNATGVEQALGVGGGDQKKVQRQMEQSAKDYQSQRLANYSGSQARGQQMADTFSPLEAMLGRVYGEGNVPHMGALMQNNDPMTAYGSSPGGSYIAGIGTPEEDYAGLNGFNNHLSAIEAVGREQAIAKLPDDIKYSQPDWYWQALGEEPPVKPVSKGTKWPT